MKSIQFDDTIFSVKILNEDLVAIAFNLEIHIYNLNSMERIKKITDIDTSYASQYCLSNGNLIVELEDGGMKILKIFE